MTKKGEWNENIVKGLNSINNLDHLLQIGIISTKRLYLKQHIRHTLFILTTNWVFKFNPNVDVCIFEVH